MNEWVDRWIYVCGYVGIHVFVYVCLCVCLYACIVVCVWIYVYKIYISMEIWKHVLYTISYVKTSSAVVRHGKTKKF